MNLIKSAFNLESYSNFLKLILVCILGRKVRISNVDAQSCLCDMLKYDIWGTFCCIAFENPFNGNRGLLKIRIMNSHKKIINAPL